VFLEAAHDGDKELPVGGRAADVEWVDRENYGIPRKSMKAQAYWVA
jgi:hypothetical protein